MLKRNTHTIKDEETRLAVEFILTEGLGNAISLSAAPVAATPLLDDNEIGIYSDKIYVRKGAKIYRIDPAATITIT